MWRKAFGLLLLPRDEMLASILLLPCGTEPQLAHFICCSQFREPVVWWKMIAVLAPLLEWRTLAAIDEFIGVAFCEIPGGCLQAELLIPENLIRVLVACLW